MFFLVTWSKLVERVVVVYVLVVYCCLVTWFSLGAWLLSDAATRLHCYRDATISHGNDGNVNRLSQILLAQCACFFNLSPCWYRLLLLYSLDFVLLELVHLGFCQLPIDYVDRAFWFSLDGYLFAMKIPLESSLSKFAFLWTTVLT